MVIDLAFHSLDASFDYELVRLGTISKGVRNSALENDQGEPGARPRGLKRSRSLLVRRGRSREDERAGMRWSTISRRS